MPSVFVVNKGGHNFEAASRYGRIVYITEGLIKPFAVDKIYREIAAKLKHSEPDDYILITGLTVINSIACSYFSVKHNGRLNILLYRNNRYIARTLMINQLS